MEPMLVRRLPRIRLLRAVSVVLGGACLGLFGWLLLRFEGQAMWQGLLALGSLLPLLVALELARGLCELGATRALLGPDFVRLPRVRFVRAQLLALCFDVILPAGRAAAESSKAVLYARDLGWPLAAAVGTALQLAVLAANALWVLVAYALSGVFALPSAIRAGLAIYAACISALVVGVMLFAAAPGVRALCERIPVLHAALSRFSEILIGARARLCLCVCAQLASRVLQALQLWAAAEALGASPSAAQALVTQAVYLVGAALGELVPAQLGTTDAAFVLAAPALGLSAAAALSATLALHAVQLTVALFAGLGALVASYWEVRRASAPLPRFGQLLRAADPGPPSARAGIGSEL
jgi:uncharacterized membrane protein YbhN (UPF0104 family)